ncbi:hypothetical protein Q5752_002583 [Cryptotrichosporon argae]
MSTVFSPVASIEAIQAMDRAGFAPDDLLVTELLTIKYYTVKRNVFKLAPERRRCLSPAVQAASMLVARAARGAENAKLRYGNRNVRPGLALAARYLIRIATLLLDAIDLRQAARDVELLADRLARFPDFHFSQFLRHVVIEARRRRELPPASMRPSPRLAAALAAASAVAHDPPSFDLDFAVADDIFAAEDWMNMVGETWARDQPVDQNTSLSFLLLCYDTYLLGNFYAYPFAKNYGSWDEATESYVVPPGWQTTMSDVGTIGNVFGLFMRGYLCDRFGHRKIIMGGLVFMTASNFMTFFAVCPVALRAFLTSLVNICWAHRFGRALAAAEQSLRRLSSGSKAQRTRETLAMYVLTDRLKKAIRTDTSFWDCLKGTNLRRTEIACLGFAAQCLSGESFAYGSTNFFTQAGFSLSNAYKPNFGALAVAFVGTVGSWLLMAAVWTQAALIIIWLSFYSLTLGPQSFGLAAEVSATRLVSQTISFARLTYQVASLLTNSTAFVWFGTSVLTIAWCALRMPETKGITYTELDILFEKRTPAWRFRKARVDVADGAHQVHEQEI